MTNDIDNKSQTDTQPLNIRLPGFIVDEPIGLGDVIKQATRTFGIKSCGGCESRAAILNSWVTFTGK